MHSHRRRLTLNGTDWTNDPPVVIGGCEKRRVDENVVCVQIPVHDSNLGCARRASDGGMEVHCTSDETAARRASVNTTNTQRTRLFA